MHRDPSLHKTKDPLAGTTAAGDDNPNDSMEGKDKTNPNTTMSAEDIMKANNFLGDL